MPNKEEEKKKLEKKKAIMVDAWTQTEKSDYALIKYKMQRRAQKQQMRMGEQDQYSMDHGGLLSDSGNRMGYDKKISSSFNAVTTPNNNRAPSQINNSYK